MHEEIAAGETHGKRKQKGPVSASPLACKTESAGERHGSCTMAGRERVLAVFLDPEGLPPYTDIIECFKWTRARNSVLDPDIGKDRSGADRSENANTYLPCPPEQHENNGDKKKTDPVFPKKTQKLGERRQKTIPLGEEIMDKQ